MEILHFLISSLLLAHLDPSPQIRQCETYRNFVSADSVIVKILLQKTYYNFNNVLVTNKIYLNIDVYSWLQRYYTTTTILHNLHVSLQ